MINNEKTLKKNIGFYIIYLILVGGTLGLYIKAIQRYEWSFKDLMEDIPNLLEPLLLNLFISIGIIIFSFCICSLLKDERSDSLRRIVTAFFCFLLIMPGGMITQPFEFLVAYCYTRGYENGYPGIYYLKLDILPIWINLMIVTSIKLLGISLILLGYLKQIKSKIRLLDTFKCSLIVALINFATLSRIAINADMWPGITWNIGKGSWVFNTFDSFVKNPKNAVELWGIILESVLVIIVVYVIYLISKNYLNCDEVGRDTKPKKENSILYHFVGE